MVEKDLLALLKESVAIESWTGQNTSGVAQYGAGVVSSARVEIGTGSVLDAQGRHWDTTAIVYVNGTVSAKRGDRITLPDGSKETVLMVFNPSDELGASYYKKLFVGRRIG